MVEQSEGFISKRLGLIISAVFLVAIGAIGGASWLYFGAFGVKLDPASASDIGQMADFFGGVLGPLLSFLSLIALLAALYVQGNELKLSREELKLSRDELAKSADALSSQNSTIERQRFEQTFFSWLSTYRELIDEVYFVSGYKEEIRSTGRKALRDISKLHDLNVLYQTRDSMPADCFEGKIVKPSGYVLAARIITSQWEDTYSNFESQLSGLFRVLFGLIRWVDQSNLSSAEKWLYISIVRAQLSSDELKLLFFNGLTDKGRKFGALANKYALFDNFDMSKEQYAKIMRESLSAFCGYESAAFSSDEAKKKYHSLDVCTNS